MGLLKKKKKKKVAGFSRKHYGGVTLTDIHMWEILDKFQCLSAQYELNMIPVNKWNTDCNNVIQTNNPRTWDTAISVCFLKLKIHWASAAFRWRILNEQFFVSRSIIVSVFAERSDNSDLNNWVTTTMTHVLSRHKPYFKRGCCPLSEPSSVYSA